MKKIILSIFLISIISFSAKAQEKDRGFIVKIGQQAPDFTVKLTTGEMFKLSENRGKIIVLQFTASWCGVCLKEAPHIEKEIWKPYKDKDLIVIGMDRDEPEYIVKNFRKRCGATYPYGIDTGAKVYNKYAKPNSGVTRNVVIDKTGKIVYLTRLFNEKEFAGMVSKIKSLL